MSRWSIEGVQRQPLEDVLAHGEGRHELQGQAGHDAERAEVDDGSGLVAGRDRDQVAVRGDDLHPGDRRGQAAVADPGAVRPGRAGAADGEVRERGEVAQREASRVDVPDQVRVRRPRRDPYGGVARSRRRARGQPQRRHERPRGVRDVGERVRAADRPHPAGARDQRLQLRDRAGAVPLGRAEADVARPVGPSTGHRHLPRVRPVSAPSRPWRRRRRRGARRSGWSGRRPGRPACPRRRPGRRRGRRRGRGR